MQSVSLIPLVLLVTAVPQTSAKPRSEQPLQVTELIAKLPECSRMRRQLEQGKFGDGIEKSYMRPMLEHGVQRVYFEVEGKWRHGHTENMQIMRRLYYRQLDGPDAQITDPAALKEIRNSGLEAALNEAVLARAKGAVLYAGIDRWAGFGVIHQWQWQLGGGNVYGAVELFASGWLSPQLPNWVFPGNRKIRESLAHAASIGDVIELPRLLSANKYSQPELNDALNTAVLSPRDNTSAIELLIRGGADVNARFGEGTTLLMLTYGCPCNIPVLLQHGARVDARDKWGRTALDLARERHDKVAERFLESAVSKP